MWVWSLGREDPLEEGMATHPSILAWIIPWSEEPDRLESIGSQRVRHDRSNSAHSHSLSQRPVIQHLKSKHLPSCEWPNTLVSKFFYCLLFQLCTHKPLYQPTYMVSTKTYCHFNLILSGTLYNNFCPLRCINFCTLPYSLSPCSLFYTHSNCSFTFPSILNLSLSFSPSLPHGFASSLSDLDTTSFLSVWAFVLGHSVMSDSLQPHGLQPTRLPIHGISKERKLEWVAISASKRSSWPRDQTLISWVSCIGRQILYDWVTWGILLSVQQFYFLLYFSCTCHENPITGQLKGRILNVSTDVLGLQPYFAFW